ncbi:unnamed protein product [Ceratitis capitata]|uniref:(Mediterranean fruit fly) hypothetical protein n=1 Tax=Ceratitis capitata TaxID=7213 RepID=A0A811U2V4_CERCA|nr:unnamed protein product [Ceratitis capitata]
MPQIDRNGNEMSKTVQRFKRHAAFLMRQWSSGRKMTFRVDGKVVVGEMVRREKENKAHELLLCHFLHVKYQMRVVVNGDQQWTQKVFVSFEAKKVNFILKKKLKKTD